MKRALKWVAALLLLFLLLVAAAVLSFPYWFGSALGTAGKRYGVSFAKYERLKDGRFALTDVVRTNALFDLRISRLEGFLPYTWYENVKRTNQAKTFLEANGWRVILHEPSTNSSEKIAATTTEIKPGELRLLTLD